MSNITIVLHPMRVLLSATVLLLNLLPTSAPAKTVSPTRDTTAVLHNPAMGLVTYTGIYPNGDIDMIHHPRTPDYSNILYIRVPWSRLEPTEGNYIWLTPNFMKQIQSMRALGFRLAFRVMCQDADTHGTPEWVLKAIRDAGQDPISRVNPKYPVPDVLNPIWRAKFRKFVLEFGKAFDDPAVTDFIDANGLGIWGEGNLVGIPDPAQQEAHWDWHLGLYNQAFKRVLLVSNFTTLGANPLGTDERISLGKYAVLFRNDGLGSNYPTDAQRAFISKHFPATTGFGELCYSFEDVKNWSADPKIIALAAPTAPTVNTYFDLALSQAFALHSNTLNFGSDLNRWIIEHPDQLARAIANLGYRLRPVLVDIPDSLRIGERMSIRHIWTNDGAGVLPNLSPRWRDPGTGKGKYRVAFAFFRPGVPDPVKIKIDPSAEPGTWIKGKESQNKVDIVWDVPAGDYELAVGIVDTTAPPSPALRLAIKDLPQRGNWYILGHVTVTP